MKKTLVFLVAFAVQISFAQSIFPTDGKNVGIGTINPTDLLHLNSVSPVLKMTYQEGGFAAIRGLNSTWIFGFNGDPGFENISFGTQDGSGSRTLTFAAGGSAPSAAPRDWRARWPAGCGCGCPAGSAPRGAACRSGVRHLRAPRTAAAASRSGRWPSGAARTARPGSSPAPRRPAAPRGRAYSPDG